jgi:hypothetical protein
MTPKQQRNLLIHISPDGNADLSLLRDHLIRGRNMWTVTTTALTDNRDSGHDLHVLLERDTSDGTDS